VGQNDLSYRFFFAHRRMIQDLLGEIERVLTAETLQDVFRD
jgi:hypothetical protein